MATSVVVLSGKGGTAKTLWQTLIAGEASREGLRVLLVDVDPERNLSNRFDAPAHTPGLAGVLTDAGVTSGESDAERGAARVDAEIIATRWPGVDLLPAGASLTGVAQVTIPDLWLLRDIGDLAEFGRRWDLVLYDTGDRTGALTTCAMYAADTAYAPITATTDAIRKAEEARERVKKIQRSHPLRWAGVVLTGFDTRINMQAVIREDAVARFGDQVRAELPRRAAVDEAFQIGSRLSDRRDLEIITLANIIRDFLLHDLIQHNHSPHKTGELR